MPENLLLFYDSIYDALRGFVSYAGGSKVVGPRIFPHKGDKAAAWLDDCLNPDRPAKLDPEELLTMVRLARDAGFHGLAQYIGDSVGYEMKVREPRDVLAELYGQFIERSKELQRLGERIERAQSVPGRKGAFP